MPDDYRIQKALKDPEFLKLGPDDQVAVLKHLQTLPPVSLAQQGRESFEAKGGNVGMPGSFEGKPENVGEYVPQTVGNVASGVGNIAEGNVARGTHEILSGGMNALLPAAPFAAAAAPVTFGVGTVGSYASGKVARKGAQIFRASPDVQDVAEDVGSIAGGAAAMAPRPTILGVAKFARNPFKATGNAILDAVIDRLSPKAPPEPTPFPGVPSRPSPAPTSSATPIGSAELPQATGAQTPFPKVVKQSEINAANRAAEKATKAQAKADEAAAEAVRSNPFAGATSSQTPIGNAKLPIPQGSPTTFPLVEQAPRRGGMAAPPSPETPVSQQSTNLLTRGKTLVLPGAEVDMNNPAHVKMVNDYQTLSGDELRVRSKAGDPFAKFVLRYMKRP